MRGTFRSTPYMLLSLVWSLRCKALLAAEQKRARLVTRPFVIMCPASVSGNQPHAFQLEQNLMGAVVHVHVFGFDAQFRVDRDVIGV